VGAWFTDQALARDDLELDVIDLRETPLPAVQQTHPVASGEYRSPRVRAFAARIGRADGFVVVTPEYNHGYPATLKLAIDSVSLEWHRKPVGFVSYGGVAGGLRAVEQLRQVFAELRMVTVRDTVSFHGARRQFDRLGRLQNPEAANAAAAILLDQLTWWARALREHRLQA
jgi:NAD(P)H-dependent FMN reductase